MNSTSMSDLGKLILRLTVGGMMLPHGIHGLMNGIDFVKASVADNGLPAFVAYGVYIGEFVAPLALILGFCTRMSGFILFINMMFTFILVHRHGLLKFNDYGAFELELNYLYAGAGLAIAFIGGGNWVLAPKKLRNF